MIGTIASSSMSSSARDVRLGSPPGIGLLMKWMTCAASAGAPTVAGGRFVCPCTSPRRCARPWARRCARYAQPIIARLASLIVVGSVALRKNIAAAVAGRNGRLPSWRSRLRIAIETSPKSMSTGHGAAHLWHTVQWSATSENSSKWRSDTPRRVCSSYRNASISSDAARILLRGE